jgi:hypothetical protein
VKAITDFNVSARYGRQFYCRECQKAWYRDHRADHIANVVANSKRYRERNRAFLLEHFRTHPCVDCGETNPDLLEFDHQRDKLKEVSKLVTSSVPLETLAAEIAKCEVRCVNCHMRRTAEQLGWRKSKEVLDADVLHMRA